MLNRTDALNTLAHLNNSLSGSCPELIMLELNGETGNALVVCKDCITNMPLNTEWEKTTWEKCSLRSWLNAEFFYTLPIELRARAVKRRNVNKNNGTIPGGNDTEDLVFLLSIDEYNAMPEELRPARLGDNLCWWWLRSPGYDGYNFANVNRCGGLDGGSDSTGRYVGHGYHVDSDSGCVRPAMYLSLMD